MLKISIKPLDKKFSFYIRSKANWTCEVCGKKYKPPTKGLHCSHFWGRRNKSVRFDPDNVIAACFGCHRKFTENPEIHREFFMERLGEANYNILMLRANKFKKPDYFLINMWLTQELKKMEKK